MHEDEKPSKSQVKRDMIALQALGERLVELPASQFRQIELPEDLREAVELARGIQAHGGRKRQLQYIGKIMRNIDAEPIRAALEALDQAHSIDNDNFHQAERWRDRLVNEGDAALEELITAYPDCDRKELRRLTHQARNERGGNKPPRSARALFRSLREFVS